MAASDSCSPVSEQPAPARPALASNAPSRHSQPRWSVLWWTVVFHVKLSAALLQNPQSSAADLRQARAIFRRARSADRLPVAPGLHHRSRHLFTRRDAAGAASCGGEFTPRRLVHGTHPVRNRDRRAQRPDSGPLVTCHYFPSSGGARVKFQPFFRVRYPRQCVSTARLHHRTR